MRWLFIFFIAVSIVISAIYIIPNSKFPAPKKLSADSTPKDQITTSSEYPTSPAAGTTKSIQHEKPDVRFEVPHQSLKSAQEIFRAEVARESLQESVKLLRSEPISDLFQSILDDWTTVYKIENSLLRDPRVSKVITEARFANSKQRASILDLALNELDSYLDYVEQRATHGLQSVSSEGPNTILAFPLLFAVADDTGNSLPYLLEWYELDQTIAELSWNDLKVSGLLPDDIEPPEIAKTQTGDMIVGAVASILHRIAPDSVDADYQLPMTQRSDGLRLRDAILPIIAREEHEKILSLASKYIESQ